jgi:predicted O-methyltransferase YrrM
LFSVKWLAYHPISLQPLKLPTTLAHEYLPRAHLSDLVDVRVGKAMDTLPKLLQEGLAPFDFIFIDADKPNNPDYLQWALKLSHPGTVIVADNIVRNGEIVNSNSADEKV